jgi:hypothetical protein
VDKKINLLELMAINLSILFSLNKRLNILEETGVRKRRGLFVNYYKKHFQVVFVWRKILLSVRHL